MSAGTKKILRDKVLLYAITPQHVGPTELGRVEELLQAGLGILQLRDKGQVAEREALARELRERCHRYNALFVVNDDVALAQASGADGVHLGPDDMPAYQAREILGDRAIIGVSAGVHERLAPEVIASADYVGVGAIFDASGSKVDANHERGPAVLRQARSAIGELPLVAIGGIDVENAAPCFAAGADGVAMIRGAFDPAIGAQALMTRLRAARAAV